MAEFRIRQHSVSPSCGRTVPQEYAIRLGKKTPETSRGFCFFPGPLELPAKQAGLHNGKFLDSESRPLKIIKELTALILVGGAATSQAPRPIHAFPGKAQEILP